MNELLLPPYVSQALDILSKLGHEAYVVGGCVRDSIMGRAVNDYDICTSALPEQTTDAFADYRVIITGIKHGTVTVMLNEQPLEITTFRNDGDYSDGRHPDAVYYTSDLLSDLSRRDFTINAMAYSPKTGIIDPFGGIADIKARSVRCVGEPRKRFSEDALRILRAIRLSSVLGFDIEPATASAAIELRSQLTLVARERIRDELCKLICGSGAEKVLKQFTSIITFLIPELSKAVNYDQNNPYHDFDLYTHLIRTASYLPPEPTLRFAGLLHDIGKPATVTVDDKGISHYHGHASVSSEIASQIMCSLRFSNSDISVAEKLIHFHDGVIEETEKAVKRRINQFGIDAFFQLIKLQRADCLAQKSEMPTQRLAHYAALDQIGKQIIEQSACTQLSDLAVNGRDLLALGYSGRQIGKALSLLLDAVINGELENEKGALICYLNDNFEIQKTITP